MKISVVGAGSWGSALAEHAGRCGHEVLLWAHDPQVAADIAATRSNPAYLPTAQFSPTVSFTNDLAETAAFSDTIMMVTPSHHYREVMRQLVPHLNGNVRVISGTKGIENDSLRRVSEITAEVLGERLRSFCTISGPTFALELSRRDPTAAVVASKDEAFASELQRELSSPYFRLYRTEDVNGTEIAGSLKNVVAIASGVIEGIGFGSNTTAALITRGLHEMRRLGTAVGSDPQTFAGLAGMGDLILTCTGGLSRNRRVGVLLGEGKKLSTILGEMRVVAEGVKTSRSAHDLAEKLGIEMPIISAMYQVLYDDVEPRAAIEQLMRRALKAETEPIAPGG